MLLRSLKSKFIGFKLNLILLLLIIRYIGEAKAFFFMPKRLLGKNKASLFEKAKEKFLLKA